MMKQVVSFCALFALCSAMEPGLRVRFGLEIFAGNNYFVEVPKTITEAESAGWDKLDRPNDGYVTSLVMYCHANRKLCLLYDDTGYIAGAQVGLPVNEITEVIYDFETMGFTLWTTTINGETADVWTVQQFYVDDEFLAIDPAERIASRDTSKILQVGGVWLVGTHKQLIFVSSSESLIHETKYTKQACIYAMGTHYYYNMSSELPCSAETLFPWFPLFRNGDLIGCGFRSYAVMPEDPVREWFERSSSELIVQVIIPRGPECLYKLASQTLTMHIYFVDKPNLMFCLIP